MIKEEEIITIFLSYQKQEIETQTAKSTKTQSNSGKKENLKYNQYTSSCRIYLVILLHIKNTSNFRSIGV